jgi:hypothetical protein
MIIAIYAPPREMHSVIYTTNSITHKRLGLLTRRPGSPASVCAVLWFERMLAEQGHQLSVGDAAEIRAAMVRKQKSDSRDACHILDLLLRDKFPRIWIPSTE